jgi:hypothetical protein
MPYKIKQFNDGFRVISDKGTILSKKPMTESNAHKQLVAVSMKNELCGAGHPHLNNDNYALHAIIFKKPIDKNIMLQQIPHYIHKKVIPFIRETNTSYRVRNIPKTKFVKSSFRTKKINSKVSLVYGELSQQLKGGSNINISLLDFIRLVRKEGLGSFSYSDVMVNKSLLNKLDELATNSGYNLILPVNKSYTSTAAAYNSYIKKRRGLGNFGTYLAGLVGIRTLKLTEPEIKQAYNKAVTYMVEAFNGGLDDSTDIYEYGYNKIKNDYPYVYLNDLAEVCQSAVDSVVAEEKRLIEGQIRNEEQIQRDYELGAKKNKKAVQNRFIPKIQFKQNKFSRF